MILKFFSSPNSSVRFYIFSLTTQMNSDKSTLGYSFFTFQIQKPKSIKNPKARHQPTPNPSSLGMCHRSSRTHHQDFLRTSFVPLHAICLLLEIYVYIFLKNASAVVLEMVLWLLFKNENYKRISQDSLLLLNKTHLEAEMSLDLSSHSTKW